MVLLFHFVIFPFTVKVQTKYPYIDTNNVLSPSTDENAQCPLVPAIIDPSKDEISTILNGIRCNAKKYLFSSHKP